MNVGLAAGRYSGTSRPDLNRTPHALHSVFGPMGPVRHCGVFSEAQWRHFLPGVSAASLFLGGAVLEEEVGSEGERRRRREDQSQGAARERLLRALPGTDTSVMKIGAWARGVCDDEVLRAAFGAEMSWRLFRSSLENESSTKFESHSSSAKSSYCSTPKNQKNK